MNYRISIRGLVCDGKENFLVKKVIRNSKAYNGDVIILLPAKTVKWLPFLIEPKPKALKVYFKPNNELYMKETLKLLAKRIKEGRVDLWYPCETSFLKTKRMRNLPSPLHTKSHLHYQLNEILTD